MIFSIRNVLLLCSFAFNDVQCTLFFVRQMVLMHNAFPFHGWVSSVDVMDGVGKLKRFKYHNSSIKIVMEKSREI